MPLGIDNFAARPIQGRGVMIDFAHHYGREFRNVGYAELREVLERDPGRFVQRARDEAADARVAAFDREHDLVAQQARVALAHQAVFALVQRQFLGLGGAEDSA